MTTPELDPEAIMEWLQASCAAQGVPVVIRDHAVISQVAALLGHAETCTGATVDKQAGGGNINSQASDSPCHVIDLDTS